MKILTYSLIGIIKLYKLFISPMFSNNSCRFEPTCSSYCIDALKTYGLFKGIYKSILRMLYNAISVGDGLKEYLLK